MIDKILSEIAKLTDGYEHSCVDNTYQRGVSDGAKWIKKKAIDIVQEVAKDGGWVSVKDRLPEDKREVLVWHSEMDMHCVAWYNPPTRIWYSNDFEIADSKYIVAWCELPAPYQKGE